MDSVESLLHLPISLPFYTEPDEIRDHIVDLLSRVPELSTDLESPSSLKIRRLTGGLTNVLFKVTLPLGIVCNIRLFGLNSHEVIDREAEKTIMMSLSKSNLGPPLYATFENGCIYGFVAGFVPTRQALIEGRYDALVAKELGRWHGSQTLANVDADQQLKIWEILQEWVQKVEKIMPSAEEFDFSLAVSLLSSLRERIYHNDEHSIGFCHNDLLPGNLIVKPCGNITFIDVEYAGLNYHLFDVANHFSERCMDYDQVQIEPHHFPSIELQKDFFKHYLVHRDGTEATDEEIDAYIKELPYFAALSNIYWSFWGIIQASSSTDFDYVKFSRLRLDLAISFIPTINDDEE